MKQALTYFSIISLGLLLSACGGGTAETSSETLDADGFVDTGSEVLVINESADSGSGSAQKTIVLSWEAPTTRVNGNYLDPNNLAGYGVYYGTSSNGLELIEEITETKRTIIVDASATYYFAVTAFDSDRRESSFSAIVSNEEG